MLDQFFQLTPIPPNAMSGTYDIWLVVLSYLVATLASYIALDITGRLRDFRNTQTTTILWIIGGAIAMGAGIWSMHFIGMLAFKMNMPMGYDAGWTFLSMIVAIFASGFALLLLSSKKINLIRMILGGIILGLAIASMHYTGMEAMTINMNIHYLPSLFFLSILIAIVASYAALYLAIKSTQVVPNLKFRLKFVSAFIMGAAICGMHYTGMASAIFTPKIDGLIPGSLNPELMAITIASVTGIILGIAFLVSTYKESVNQQLLKTARQAGMAEVASSVLHNVGNVLNSVNVSSTIIAEKINKSKLSALSDLKTLLEENKMDFNKFMTEDERAKHLPQFLTNLADYWEVEKAMLENETSILIKNIEHIKKIISAEQEISRVSEYEQVTSIADILDESILICGIEDKKYDIQVFKDYSYLKPVMVDKGKLLQIVVNITQNAKDALSGSSNGYKKINFILGLDHSHYFIQVTDNGVGIARDKLNHIFEYGFTTKAHGHGFGLHMSAITVKEMGGELTVNSEGVNKGATFTIILPYKTID